MPTREMLDLAAPDHPVLMWPYDLHLAAANSIALRMADINSQTPDIGTIAAGIRYERRV